MATRRVLGVALASRACISLLAAATARLVAPYDTSARLLSTHALASLANWDGVYFAQIAARGYEYEQTHAFFPLYALLVRWLSASGALAVPLAGWLVSNACCVLAALYLYKLGRLVLRHERTARRAAYLFCVAPSSIFMTALYSESLMCLLSFAGMFYVESYRRERRFALLLVAAALFGAASATRSNGALLSLYIAWYRLVESPSPLKAPGQFLTHWLATALLGVIAVGPQVWYFVHGIRVYCPTLVRSLFPHASLVTRIIEDRPWCASVIPNVSAMYMFIQREYWNVGLLRYYEWRQLPNFLLASPVILLSAYSLARFFFPPASKSTLTFKLPAAATPYFIHWGFLLVNALLVVHIQVTTRLLAACPPLFWAPAALFFSDAPPHATTAGKVVVAYFLVYYVLGAGLFTSFYPWT